MQQFIKKMITERDDLKGKISRDKKALENPPYGSDQEGLSLLETQVGFMEQYLNVLERRIDYEVGKCGRQ